MSDLSQNDIITDTNQHKPITRSATRKQQQQDNQQRPDDDTLEDEQYYSRLNERFNDVREYMQSHEDFMYQIFGHRNDTKVLDFDKYRHYQESDNVLAAAIRLFKSGHMSNWNEKDVDLVYDWNYDLFELLEKGKVCIENNILMVKIWNPKYHKIEKKIVVPFFLIGKLMDYAHHNIQQHHHSAEYTEY